MEQYQDFRLNSNSGSSLPKKWYKDRPLMIALVSGLFSTVVTLINVFLK